ncbi:MAG: hypothetical protein A2113_02195 [Candidatus Woykebacteria bacterium GWA1_44_8]|uniref:Thioredoxin domain-containing protein n=1 Tax=Candidatus Woykebacteria bacterium GWA1_44_8 TaxID=1802591 RepID=A0A1G1W4T5_9BACT|nr:MAG: hypothetical protein A2113_02195 [Candidatus Woykebacteria bacterium GWA1_44_8]
MSLIKKLGLISFIFLAAWVGFLFTKPNISLATEKPQIIYFYQETCLECKKIEPFLNNIQRKYQGKIIFEKLELTKAQENRNAYFAFASEYGLDTTNIGVPLIFIGEKSLMGEGPVTDELENEIKTELKNPIGLKISLGEAKKIPAAESQDIGCVDKTVCKTPNSRLTLPLVVATAAVDSINPCAIAVLIILISFLLGISASKKRLLLIGLIYIGAVYIAYLLAGLGILKFIQVLPIQVEWIQIVAAIFLFIFALLNFNDAFASASGEKTTLAIPAGTKPLIQKYLSRATIFGALIAGVIVSFVELPCTGAVYFGILSLMATSVTFLKGLAYLVLYNFIFVAPLLVILVAAVAGKDIKTFEKLSKENKALVKALMGTVIVVLIGALIWPIRDFISWQLQNLASFAAGKEISSLTILVSVLISITVLYFLLAYFKPVVTKKIKVFYCAICYAVSLTWLWLLALLVLGFKYDTKILAVLLGMSVVGIMYQLEDYFKKKDIKRFWLFRIVLINAGILLIYGVLFVSFVIFLIGLAGVLILLLLFFYLAARRRGTAERIRETITSKQKGKALKDLEDRLENCC